MIMKNNYVLIEEISEEQTESGLWIPPSANNRRAIVLEIAEDEDIKVGDEVLKNVGRGTQIRLEGKWVEAINRKNLLAVKK